MSSRKNNNDVLPKYTIDKKVSNRKLKKILIPIIIIALLAVVIYVPPLIFRPSSGTYYDSVAVEGDVTALQEYNTYKSNHLNDDADGDGLNNDFETQKLNTDIYAIDSDGDGVTDFAELNINNPPTNPAVKDDGMIQFQKKQNDETGTPVNKPFKDNGVIMWADDVESQARGTNIMIYDNVYKFLRFNGYVQFPEGTADVCKIENGYQKKLTPKVQNNMNCYYIEAANKPVYVKVHAEPVHECGCLKLFGSPHKIGSTGFAKFLTAILPSKGTGLITCQMAVDEDFDVAEQTVALNDPQFCSKDKISLQDTRFAKNYNTVGVFRTIKQELDRGNNILISLVSNQQGEAIIEINGYTSKNNFMVCDPETGNSLGILQIELTSARLLDYTGSIQRYEWFDYRGCGYSFGAKDRIAIDCILQPNGAMVPFIENNGQVIDPESTEPEPTETEEPTEPTEEPTETTEPVTEAPTEVPTEPDPLSEILSADDIKHSIIEYTPEGGVEEVYYDSGNKLQRVVNNVSMDEYTKYKNFVIEENHFDYYLSTEGSTDNLYCSLTCDGIGNLIYFKYQVDTQSLLMRYEAYDIEHVFVDEATGVTLAFQPDMFLKDLIEQ